MAKHSSPCNLEKSVYLKIWNSQSLAFSFRWRVTLFPFLTCFLQDAGQLTLAEIHAAKIASLLLILYIQHFPDGHTLGWNLRHTLNYSVNKIFSLLRALKHSLDLPSSKLLTLHSSCQWASHTTLPFNGM